MAISPLDLQTLFTQADKAAKQDAAVRSGMAHSQSMDQAKIQQQLDQRHRSVNETENTGDGTEKVLNKKGGKDGGGAHGRRSNDQEQSDEAEKHDAAIIRDPDLGKNLDVSL